MANAVIMIYRFENRVDRMNLPGIDYIYLYQSNSKYN